MFERVTGPVRGYYIAAYACPVGEFGREYAAYYKVCGSRIDSYFDLAACLVKGTADPILESPAAALELAIARGMEEVRNLPSKEPKVSFARRSPSIWESWDFGLAP